MGVPGLWDVLRPAGKTRSLTHLAVVDGFERNPGGKRGFRIGIDASIWFYHATYGKEGENPELRTLFFRCARLMSMPFLPLFVFDGPHRPDVKRGKRITGKAHWMIQGMQEIIGAFGFEWRMAPGEAEAELAYLNRIGIIDAVLSDDVDTFLFGATMVVRNPSATLSGNRAHPVKNSAGRDDGNHTVTYKSQDLLQHQDITLTHGGLILIGVLRGGDYHQAGLSGCGPTIAHGLAKCGFGDSLLTAAQSLSRNALSTFLDKWRADLREELRTNSRGLVGRKQPSLAKSVPDDFPDIDIVLSYASPITSESRGKNVDVTWEKEPDLGKIAGLCEMYFEWGVKEIIVKRFRTVLWPSAVLRILRRAAILTDKKEERNAARTTDAVPATPRKNHRKQAIAIGTPSKMIAKHFSSLQLNSPSRRDGDSDEEDEAERLIVKVHSSRTHASTDGILEYRLEIAPAQLVRLSEAGVRGLRTALVTGLDDSDVDGESDGDDDDENGKRKGKAKKPPPDPQSHLRIWMPACMVRMVEPDLVSEFEEIQAKKHAKKAGKKATPTNAGSSKSKMPAAKRDKNGSKENGSRLIAVRENEEEDLFLAKGDEAVALQKTDDAAIKPSREKKAGTVRPSKTLITSFDAKQPAANSKATSTTAKVSALFRDIEPLPNSRASKGKSIVSLASGSEDSSDEECRPNNMFQKRNTSMTSGLSSLSTAVNPRARSTPSVLSLFQADSEHIASRVPLRPTTVTHKPRPFPMAFDEGAEAGPSSLVARPVSPPSRRRSRSPRLTESDSATSKVQKSPRRSRVQRSPRSNRILTSGKFIDQRSTSPTPCPSRTAAGPISRNLQPKRLGRAAQPVIIEISSDSDEPTVAAIPPLLIAKAKSAPASQQSLYQHKTSRIKAKVPQSRPKMAQSSEIVDLT